MREPPRRNFIYVVGREEGPVKVGITSSLCSRLSALQTGCPFKIQLLHCVGMRDREHAIWHERNFHEVYREKRTSGEWFDLDADLAIECVQTALDYECLAEMGR